MDGTWDEVLERLAGTGPEFGERLSNHGPMATEALLRLGRPDAVASWLDGYLPRLEEAPRPRFRIGAGDWRESLGDIRRIADWVDLFRSELAEAPWQEVLRRWWPRLLPGVSAAATHGVIRTSHVVRALGEAVTPQRLDELARALGYWSAAFQPLPGGPTIDGRLSMSVALDGMPLLARDLPGNIIAQLRGLDQVDGFAAAVRALEPPRDPLTALDEMIIEFARVFLWYGRHRPIAFVHAVTAPVAVRSVLTELPPDLWRPSHDALWQACAGLYAAFRGTTPAEPLPGAGAQPDSVAPPDQAELAERAIATGDEHAIKMTEACLRHHSLVPDPVLLHAAARASDLLGR